MNDAFIDGLRSVMLTADPAMEYPDEMAFEADGWMTFYRGDLPPPFHRGMNVVHSNEQRGHNAGASAARSIVRLSTKTGEVVEQMRRQVDILEKAIRGTGMDLLSYRPHNHIEEDGSWSIDMLGRFRYLNHTLMPTEKIIFFGASNIGWKGFAEIRREARAQPERAECSGRGMVADMVTSRLLAKMTDSNRNRLAEILRKNPIPPSEERGLALLSTWPAAKLKSKGVTLPTEIETISVRSGRIVARTRIAPGTTWNAGTLKHRGDVFPQSLIASMEGRMLREIVEHPLLDGDDIIVSARNGKDGMLILKVDAATMRFPAERPEAIRKPRSSGKEAA